MAYLMDRQDRTRMLRATRLACLLAILPPAAHGLAQSETPPAPVVVAPVVLQEVSAGQSFVGTVLPRRTSTVGSAVEERVIEFPVREGDRVRQGDVLARLRTTTLEIQLAGARAELEVRRQELAELENGTRPEDIEQGRARLGRAKSLRDITLTRSRRAINLRQTGAASAEELEDRLADAEQAEQAYQEARSALQLLLQGPRVEMIARARAQVLVQDEEIRRQEDVIANHTIVAPFDGYVVAEYTEVGQWVARGEPIIDLVELDTVEINVAVLEDYIRFLTVGTTGRVEVGAVPDEAFTGEVARIVPQADLRSRSFPVKVRVENEDRDGVAILKAGMFARVTLPVGFPRDALLVPKDALVLGGRSPVVIVVDPRPDDATLGTARAVPVQLGVAEKSLVQIIGDVEKGQNVVVQGNERLRPGQTVVMIPMRESRVTSTTPFTTPSTATPAR